MKKVADPHVKKHVKKRSRLERVFIKWNRALRGRTDSYLSRRPHRSFRRTYRRDYVRSLKLPGYVALTRDALGVLFHNRRLFGSFFLAYSLVSIIVLGLGDQDNYAKVVAALNDSASNAPLKVVTLFGAALAGGFRPPNDSDTSILSTLLILLAWLIMTWLLRHVVNGKRVTLRQAAYHAGAPLIPTAVLALIVVIQVAPLAIATLLYTWASSTQLLSFGIEGMLVFAAALLLMVLSAYWLSSTFIALVIVTLPGMYPWAALRAAGDLVIGRRLRMILRLLWLAVSVLVMWAVILIPAILLAQAIPLEWLPLVPVTILGLTTFTLMFASSYIYLLYRAMVDDGAKPA